MVTAISHIRDGLNWPVVGWLCQAPPVIRSKGLCFCRFFFRVKINWLRFTQCEMNCVAVTLPHPQVWKVQLPVSHTFRIHKRRKATILKVKIRFSFNLSFSYVCVRNRRSRTNFFFPTNCTVFRWKISISIHTLMHGSYAFSTCYVCCVDRVKATTVLFYCFRVFISVCSALSFHHPH